MEQKIYTRMKKGRTYPVSLALPNISGINKTMLRLARAASLRRGTPAGPTSSRFSDSRGREYRVFSDGSYRRIVTLNRKGR